MGFWQKLATQLVDKWRQDWETNSQDKWLLLRDCWNNYPAEQRDVVLRLAKIDKAQMPIESYNNTEKRQIALAIRDIRLFNQIDQALNGKALKRWETLNKDFKK